MAQNLVIVESPSKAKTIGKYLGRGYKVVASVGHVRDLPPKKLGVDVDNDFRLEYDLVSEKAKVIKQIEKEAKAAESVFLATDYDREGEAIAWHVTEAAGIPREKQRRITFTEITRPALQTAMASPRDIDLRLVDAQQARRGIDRLVGYPVSQLLWQKIRYGLSAGRVQSPALRLVVEREREIRAFVSIEYWTVEALLATSAGETFVASLVQIGDRRVPTKIGRGSEEDAEGRIPEEAEAGRIVAALEGATWTVQEVRKRESRKLPSAPFITSSFQQEASRKLGLGARRSMALAQRLYELGHITYMRTDSTTMAESAQAQAAEVIKARFGNGYWNGRYREHDRKVKGAQEAHECIRPTDMSAVGDAIEATIRSEGGRDADALVKVYDLIWKRATSSLMSRAVYDQVSVDIAARPADDNIPVHMFRASGSTLKFDGYLRVYREGVDDEQEEDESILPDLEEKQPLELRELRPTQHFTQPPPRYTEATLIKELESRGIGRPSTYTSIMGTLADLKRDFTRMQNKRFVPTDTGEVVTDFLVRYFGDHFMDYEFTSEMEEHLDEIAEGKRAYHPVVESFYRPLQDRLTKGGEVSKEEVTTEWTDQLCPNCNHAMVIKLGRRGKFLACTNYPECTQTMPLPGQESEAPELLDEKCPECGSQLQKKTGRFGPFVGCSNYPECKYIQKKEVVKTGVSCPRCIETPCKRCAGKGPGELVERKGRSGVFYGCNHYPACRYTQNADPRVEPAPENTEAQVELAPENTEAPADA